MFPVCTEKAQGGFSLFLFLNRGIQNLLFIVKSGNPVNCHGKKSVIRGGSENGGDKIADVVHGMVVFLFGGVLLQGVVPAVDAEFSYRVTAAGRNKNLAVFKCYADKADSVGNVIYGWDCSEFAVSAYTLNKACG